MDKYYLIVFKNTMDAIKAEEILKKENLKIAIMPTPTYITQSCGISIKFDEKDWDNIKDLIEKGLITPKNVYVREDQHAKQIL
ncbi:MULTISPECIES: DUF3343 domain-containing protein [Clostridium]|uniref:DUF3343 domain-containing protein n=1 Tax=Clostridium cadaveris TaxID=1529 RepID=A0A1I2NCC9_9CLOT|nr:DUF3343 domain-containing protein [Clostridium cadaveris]MDU4952608.1 DUF3343 domain-containing protein [Clostridium sp.]MDM8312131.1 DUF3343 domain-containing protein [Clostridium cadaveris]MDY4949631.1 DUF3343 domain-containing protein [Clostridium cadaveris]NME65584.1 DUF3343 domain-containing protein [Clostridium cadaveris]NWK11628.1 DUF3343 domain-containing protein [Clostridium cadaveris]